MCVVHVPFHQERAQNMERDISFNGRQSQVITLTREKGAGTVNDDVVKGEYIYKYIHIHMQQQHTTARGKDQRQSQSERASPGVGAIPHSAQL